MWFEYGGGKELHQELYDRQGYQVKVFQTDPRPMQNFLWARKPLRTLEDFRGLRIRMNPGMGDVLLQHGFSVVFMPGQEILRSLQKGQIDAAKFGMPSSDKGVGLWESCKYVMLPGMHCPSFVGEILINKTAYETLSDELKSQLETAIYAANYKTFLWLYAQDLEAVEFFKEQGVETVMMDPETVETFAKWARE